MSSESPPHVVLWGVAKPPNAPSSSGFCQKLETFLRFSDISYELAETLPGKAPKGKVPFADIKHDGKTVSVADSHFIIGYLVENGLIEDPDTVAGLTPVQKGESRAWQAYIEEVLYHAIVRDRWYIDENYAVTSQEIFGGMSWPVRPLLAWYLRRSVMQSIWNAGTGRHSQEEAQSLQKEAFEALEARMSGHLYFHGGERPTRIDLTVYGFLANTLATEGNPYWASMVLGSSTLLGFTKKMTTSLFPEYEKLLQRIEEAEIRLQQAVG
ncbi:hypothetical protein K503DRAFT_714963 [Rhizopogon vinicolor AM-OR11-026]|uniref:Thioredoxin-like fold domain-containing protein n=1 Tax=Rhizopogon vinicolor AM-OR11-026 TaxID=1314800 RepID=A0A1B7N5P1_9AGAM|nr:hypothetical protein K503DRAFT_714963 [Rhizopogon vinicolor AM-OR11-026]